MSRKHVFGEHGQWAIGVDDSCLQFYPQYSINPSIKATHIWKEAWMEVQRLGGYEETVKLIRSL